MKLLFVLLLLLPSVSFAQTRIVKIVPGVSVNDSRIISLKSSGYNISNYTQRGAYSRYGPAKDRPNSTYGTQGAFGRNGRFGDYGRYYNRAANDRYRY